MLLFETILVVVWTLSLLTTLLNIAFIPRLQPVRWTTRGEGEGPKPSEPLPTVSIVVPARNEERKIEQSVRALLAQTYEPFEVIVVNDRSTDRTAALLDALAASDQRLTVVHGEEPPAGWLGKPWALHEGSRHARGELLLFVDADIHYAPEAVATLVQNLEKRSASMVALLPQFEMEGFWEAVGITELALTAYSVLPVWLGNYFTGFVDLGIGGGPGNLVRRAAFEEMGGYETLKNAVIDDVGMARQLRAHGHGTAVVLGDRLASLRMYHGVGEVVEGFTKNLFAVFAGNYFTAAAAIVLMLATGVVPYLLALRGDALAIIAVALITVTRLILFLHLRYRLDVALVGHPLTMLLWTWIALRSAAMTGIQRQLRWRGRSYGTEWTRFGRKK